MKATIGRLGVSFGFKYLTLSICKINTPIKYDPDHSNSPGALQSISSCTTIVIKAILNFIENF